MKPKKPTKARLEASSRRALARKFVHHYLIRAIALTSLFLCFIVRDLVPGALQLATMLKLNHAQRQQLPGTVALLLTYTVILSLLLGSSSEVWCAIRVIETCAGVSQVSRSTCHNSAPLKNRQNTISTSISHIAHAP